MHSIRTRNKLLVLVGTFLAVMALSTAAKDHHPHHHQKAHTRKTTVEATAGMRKGFATASGGGGDAAAATISSARRHHQRHRQRDLQDGKEEYLPLITEEELPLDGSGAEEKPVYKGEGDPLEIHHTKPPLADDVTYTFLPVYDNEESVPLPGPEGVEGEEEPVPIYNRSGDDPKPYERNVDGAATGGEEIPVEPEGGELQGGEMGITSAPHETVNPGAADGEDLSAISYISELPEVHDDNATLPIDKSTTATDGGVTIPDNDGEMMHHMKDPTTPDESTYTLHKMDKTKAPTAAPPVPTMATCKGLRGLDRTNCRAQVVAARQAAKKAKQAAWKAGKIKAPVVVGEGDQLRPPDTTAILPGDMSVSPTSFSAPVVDGEKTSFPTAAATEALDVKGDEPEPPISILPYDDSEVPAGGEKTEPPTATPGVVKEEPVVNDNDEGANPLPVVEGDAAQQPPASIVEGDWPPPGSDIELAVEEEKTESPTATPGVVKEEPVVAEDGEGEHQHPPALPVVEGDADQQSPASIVEGDWPPPGMVIENPQEPHVGDGETAVAEESLLPASELVGPSAGPVNSFSPGDWTRPGTVTDQPDGPKKGEGGEEEYLVSTPAPTPALSQEAEGGEEEDVVSTPAPTPSPTAAVVTPAPTPASSSVMPTPAPTPAPTSVVSTLAPPPAPTAAEVIEKQVFFPPSGKKSTYKATFQFLPVLEPEAATRRKQQRKA